MEGRVWRLVGSYEAANVEEDKKAFWLSVWNRNQIRKGPGGPKKWNYTRSDLRAQLGASVGHAVHLPTPWAGYFLPWQRGRGWGRQRARPRQAGRLAFRSCPLCCHAYQPEKPQRRRFPFPRSRGHPWHWEVLNPCFLSEHKNEDVRREVRRGSAARWGACAALRGTLAPRQRFNTGHLTPLGKGIHVSWHWGS